jgi:Ca-activated chloride channel family protein
MSEIALENFHFLRPLWLLVIPFAIWLHLRLRRQFKAAAGWKNVIAPHLLQYLTVDGTSDKWLRPYQLMTAALILTSVALSGPTWQRVITPFTEDKAPFIIALQMTPTMLATDQQPTRLERAKQKIRDLLERRQGARTAVIAYAGSAHAVLPLTDDSGLIGIYLESILPGVMPRDGNDATLALKLAEDMLAKDEAAGTILFMTDGIDRTNAATFAEHQSTSTDQVLLLGFGGDTESPINTDQAGGKSLGLIDGYAPAIDTGGLKEIASASGTTLVRATPDGTDIDTISRRITSNLVNAIDSDENLQWRDFGYYLLWPLAFLILLWSRRGWTVRWS